jgi:nitroimidazol reductase NimA-like FMN-containing flavoprotein (pyridoxamine 5'-phosphate oxidase superfamily)
LLTKLRFGRLACVKNSQPYITPLYYAVQDNAIYSFSTVGQKIEWMRDNPLVCVEADEIASPQHWSSVIVLGRFQELPQTPEWRPMRDMVHQLLEQRNVWWEPGFAKTIVHGSARALVPVFFRISIEQITGRRATSEGEIPETEDQRQAWWKRLLGRA